MAEGPERKQQAAFRQQLQARLDHGSDTLEEQRKEPNPTLEQLPRAVGERRQELTGSLTAALLEQRYAAEQGQPQASCPQCGRVVAARAVVNRTVETLVGALEVERPSLDCEPGSHGFFPLEAALGVAAGRQQVDLPQAGAKLAAEVPYETARELFAELTGRTVGTERRPTLTNAVAEGLAVLAVTPTREARREPLAAVAAGHRHRPSLGLALEGA